MKILYYIYYYNNIYNIIFLSTTFLTADTLLNKNCISVFCIQVFPKVELCHLS
ncbi:hypothetical protein SAMN06298211_11164 [Prevotellaceae bacterium MN60]|nr:hypothetical protein SAMN06298211_11164 [Prevotellaceae bacterium MN60]